MQSNDQMELKLVAAPCRSKNSKNVRSARSHWWFEQMQKAVDEAIDWKAISRASMKNLAIKG